jgi:glycosyltransferase involved in cell wall biosynthesis
MEKKRLIIFMPTIEDGGVKKNFFIISNFLSKKFDNVSVITTSSNIRNKLDKKINLITSKFNFFENIGKRKKFFVCLLILLREIIFQKNTVVLSFQGNVYCALLCWLMSVRVIIRANTSPSGWSKNKVKFYLYKFFYGIADHLVVNSYEFSKELKKKFNLNPICIYNPLDVTNIKKLSNKKVRFNFFSKKFLNIICMSRLSIQKDHFCFLEAMKKIKNKINFRVLFIGNGDQSNEIKKYVINNKLTKNILIKNHMKNPFPYLKKSDVLILSSKYEGLPNVLLESLSIKKPVISSDCPTGPKEILDNGLGGLLFKTGNVNDLIKKIIFFQKNLNKCKKKALYGHKRLSRFNSKKNLNKYVKLINSF